MGHFETVKEPEPPEVQRTDREKIVWLADAMGTHHKSSLMCEWISGWRYYFNKDGEVEKILVAQKERI